MSNPTHDGDFADIVDVNLLGKDMVMKKLALLMVVMFCSAICFAQSSDPLAKGEDFVRICIRSDYGHQAIESGGDSAKVAACNMYVWGIVSGVNLYSSLSPQDILAAKKRGEASSYGVGSLEAMRKTADSFNLLCVPDEVTVWTCPHF